MKKIIAILTLLLAFSINATAQDKKAVQKEIDYNELAPEVAGKKEAGELKEYLGLDDVQYANFASLFTQKHETLQVKGLSEERKTELRRVIEAKIRATLGDDIIEKLERNPELLKKLLN